MIYKGNTLVVFPFLMINYIIFLAVYAIIYERKYRMLITGILITIVALFMVLVPQFFMKLKSPRIPDGLLKNPKMKIVLRIWESFL